MNKFIKQENGITYEVRELDGSTFYYVNQNLHREGDLPAFESKGGGEDNNIKQSWWINGERHRINGPAIIYDNGIQEWWYQNQQIHVNNQEEYERWLRLKAFE